jgi:O-antigen/teichoic acid export membrane protein
MKPTEGSDTRSGGAAKGSMVPTAVRGVSWTMLGSIGQAALQMVTIVVLSRLVSVEEYGVAAAATVVIGLAVMLSQLGIGPALVQARTLDRTDIASAFVLATTLGVLLAGAMFAAAPLIGPLVGLPADSSYLQILSIVLVLGGVNGVASGLLQRDMRFRAITLVDLPSYGIGYLGTAATLAYFGAGTAAIVWGQVTQTLMTTVGYYALVRHDVRPRRIRVMVARGRRLFRFGSAYSVSQVGNWLANNGDNLVITTTLGAPALGIYSRAYQLLVQPATLIGGVADKVVFPAMSRIQHDSRRLAHAFVRMNSLIAMLTLPASVLIIVAAPEIVVILLGRNWSAVTLPLQIFAAVLLPRTAYKISGSLTRATGAVVGGALRQWIYAAFVVVGCVVGSRWGLAGVAAGTSVAIVVHTLVMLKFSSRIKRGLVGDVLRAYAKSLPAAAATAAVCWPLAVWLRDSGVPAVVTLLVTSAAGLLMAGLVLLAMRRMFAEELAVLAQFRPRKRSTSRAAATAHAG